MSPNVARDTLRANGTALVEKEIISSTAWFIGIRWIAGLGVLASTWFATTALNIHFPDAPLYAIGVLMLVYNAVFMFARARVLRSAAPRARTFEVMTSAQILLDYLAMTALIHYSGGLESPATFYFVFHIIIAAILLSPRETYAFASLAVALVSGTAWLEAVGVIPHVQVREFIDADLYRGPVYIFGKLLFFISTVYVTAYLTATLNSRLRARAADVIALSQHLQSANSRLETLYASAQAVNSTLELREVLQRLVEGTAKAMRVRACSVRMLDETGTRLHVMAAFGLSDAYIQKGDLVLEHNPLAREVLAGRTIVSNDVEHDASIQYPMQALAEGIQAMLSAPLRGKRGPFGLIRAYSAEPNHFTDDDANFLIAIASQGSIAIENALAYEELGRLDQLKSKFVLTVTHELRSPVSVIRSLLRTILGGFVGALSDDQRDLITRALRRGDFLQTLIDDLLDLAAGKSDLAMTKERTPVLLDQAAERIVKQFEVAAEEKKIALVLRCEGAPLTIRATSDGIERVLGNLVSNAIKYTPTGGRVQVTLQPVDDHAQVEVADSGIGIPEESLPKLFEEFYRAPNAKAIQKEGTGLGLVIVKDLVMRFGGRISVQSRVGEGTTFTVVFPLFIG